MIEGTLDCRSNSCIFALERGGQRVNGGCTCLRHRVDSDVTRREIERTFWYLQKERDNYRKALEYIAGAELSARHCEDEAKKALENRWNND